MLRNILGSVGFGKAARGSKLDRAQPVSALSCQPVTRLTLPEKRSISSESGDLTKNIFHILQSPSSSGAIVNEWTALNVAAVTACVSLLADMTAKLPLYLYKTGAKGPEKVTDHPGIQLIGAFPSELHTSFELRQLMETGKGLGGNGYARVFRDRFGDPRSIQWLRPCDVEPRLVQRDNGERFVAYQVVGEKVLLTRYDIIHVRGFSRDGVSGLSPIRLLRDSIGVSLAQTEAAGKLMRDGTHFPGYLVAPESLSAKQMEDAREEWDKHTAGAKNAGRVPIMHGGFDFKQTNGMSMVDVQFLESRRFEIQEIARMYRIPSFLIGDSTASTTWGSGIEQQTLGFLNFCLDSHLVGWEQSLAHTLLTTDEQKGGYYFKFDRNELANVALEARANFYQTMRNIGVYSPNDVLRKMDEQTISTENGGDDYGKPFNASGGTPIATEPQPKHEPVPA